jgi:hypothetical protein
MKKYLLILQFFFLAIIVSFGQEGMWLLSQLGQLDLSKKGLSIPVSSIYNKDKASIANAVIILDGGTASFVSPDGLVVTNHHVAFAALQRSSTVSKDYLEKGFLATTRADEIQAPGYTAQMLMDMKDVTTEVTDAAKGVTDPVEKDKKINSKIAAMTDALEKGKDDVNATVSEMYNGKQYILFVYKLFKDIRLVYSPPLSIGNYGGETDNWMWPRHTGDFSFVRVYVSPDGTGKDYSKDNVPYKPKIWLKVSNTPLKEGNFNFIVGYPGNTTRYRTATSVHWNEVYNYPFSIKNFHEILTLCDEITKNDPAGQLKVANFEKGLANAMKNYEGKLEGMLKTNFLQKKVNFEKEFQSWADSKTETKAKYGSILDKERDQYKVIAAERERDNVLGILQGLAGTEFNIANTIYFFAKEMQKPESERQPGITDRMIQQTMENLQYSYDDYYEPVDKALLTRVLKMADTLRQDQRIHGLDYILNDKSKPIAQFVDEAYKNSKMNDVEYAKTLFKKSPEELAALNDPFMKMAISIYPETDKMQKTNQSFGAHVTDLRKQYMDGLYEWKGKTIYPDANRTIRFTSGNIKGYQPRNSVWYYPFTTLAGVVEKNTGVEPFNAPAALLDLYKKKDFGKWMDPGLKDVPVAFINQCDITGGNSGSPVMNAKGELIGVVFDGNYEGLISDWQYDFNLQRAISVDIRYVLFVTEKIGKAGFILDEMGVTR